MLLNRMLSTAAVLVFSLHAHSAMAQNMTVTTGDLMQVRSPMMEQRQDERHLERVISRLDRAIGREQVVLESLESYPRHRQDRVAIRQSRDRLMALRDERRAARRELKSLYRP
jgi:septal ring factor EnvC (AmiA/AmiB activator)